MAVKDSFNRQFKKFIYDTEPAGSGIYEWTEHIKKNLHKLSARSLEYMITERCIQDSAWSPDVVSAAKECLETKLVEGVLLSGLNKEDK